MPKTRATEEDSSTEPPFITAEDDVDDARQTGDFVDLRAEMDLIVALSNCPHPLDPAPDYAPPPVEAIRFRAPAPAADDLCRTATIEAVRGFENNAR